MGGATHPCSFASAGSSCYKMWVGLNGFDPMNDLVLGGVRIGMGCMDLVTAISRSMRVPITLILQLYKALCMYVLDCNYSVYMRIPVSLRASSTILKKVHVSISAPFSISTLISGIFVDL